MAFTVRIRQHERALAVAAGETILAAALKADVPYPHGCQAGNCGTCKSRLYAGEVAMAPYSSYALSAAERSAGLILACRAVPRSDAEVGWLDSDGSIAHPVRRLACRVVTLEDATHDIRRVRLAVEAGGPFRFSAGQYARASFGVEAPRDYSMANTPAEPVIEFHIRALSDGRSSRYAAERLALGEAVEVEGPFGTAYWRARHPGPLLAIAGGSGLAPIKSIVETALAHGMCQPIELYFGARGERDLYLEDRFAALARRHANLSFIPVLSAPERPSARRRGLVHEEAAAARASYEGWKAYLAGPLAMVEAATATLRARGMRTEDIHADAFYTEAEKAGLAAPR